MVVTLYAAGSARYAEPSTAPSVGAGTDEASGAAASAPTGSAPASVPGAPTGSAPASVPGAPTIDHLRTMLDLAAGLELDDVGAWDRLRDEARVVIDALIAAGAVPQHLAVRIDELPVVVRRTVAEAYRRAVTRR